METPDAPRNPEIEEIDRAIESLSLQIQNNQEHEGRHLCFLLAGGFFLLLGVIALPYVFEKGLDLTLTQWTFLLVGFGGLPMFVKGWGAHWQQHYRYRQLSLCRFARHLKRAETDPNLKLSTELDGHNLVFHLHDREWSPERRCWVKGLFLSYPWGKLYINDDSQPTYRWRQKQQERTELRDEADEKGDDIMARELREYKLYTMTIPRSAIEAGYDIHARHFIPRGEDFEGWELLSVSPLEKESNENSLTLLALIAR